MSFDFKTATPITSGLNANNLFFGANSQSDSTPHIYTLNALADYITSFISSSALSVGDSSANLIANSTVIKIANSTSQANLKPTSLVIGANVTLDTGHIAIGNSVANLYGNSTWLSLANSSGQSNIQPTQIVVGTSVMNATTLALGSNVFVSSANIQIGNSTANISANSILISLANSTGIANLQPTQLVIGNVTINTTVASVGANVLIDVARVFHGNSTVNSMANSVLIKIANSSGIANLQPTQLLIGNAIVNTTVVAVGANIVINTTAIFIGNSTVNSFANSLLVQVSNSTYIANLNPGLLTIGNSTVNTTAVGVGNSTANIMANSVLVSLANASGTANLQPTVISVGNSTVFCNIGSAGISLTASNTFNLGAGSKTAAANGYTFLPNGLILQWGWVAANATAGNITFPVAFPTTIFSFQAVSNSAVAANTVAVIAANTTTMNVRSTSVAAASNSYWLAIGN